MDEPVSEGVSAGAPSSQTSIDELASEGEPPASPPSSQRLIDEPASEAAMPSASAPSPCLLMGPERQAALKKALGTKGNIEKRRLLEGIVKAGIEDEGQVRALKELGRIYFGLSDEALCMKKFKAAITRVALARQSLWLEVKSLGKAYALGREVDKNYAKARIYLEKAIKFLTGVELNEALFLLSLLNHVGGYGVDVNYELGQWYFMQIDWQYFSQDSSIELWQEVQNCDKALAPAQWDSSLLTPDTWKGATIAHFRHKIVHSRESLLDYVSQDNLEMLLRAMIGRKDIKELRLNAKGIRGYP